MPDYKSMYLRLAGKVADAIELLIQAQLEGEESALEDPKQYDIIITEDLGERD